MPLTVLSDAMSLFTTLSLTEVIKSFSWLMATSPPQGESDRERQRERESVADACAVPIARDATLIWLIYSSRTTVWDNHHMEGFSTIIHFPNRRDENVLFMEACFWKDSVATRQKSISNWSVGLSSVLSTVWSACYYHNLTYEVKSIALVFLFLAPRTYSLKRQDTKGWLISIQRKEMH